MVGTLSSVVDRPALSEVEGPVQPAAPPAVSTQVDIVTDASAFRALEREWNDAVERSRVPHPFLRHEWLTTWWECFGSGSRLHVIVVRIAGRIVAIAPFVADDTRMYGIPVRRVRLLHNDHTPRADFIVADHADEAYRAIWTALCEGRDGWDVLELSQVPADSPTRERLFAFAQANGCRTGVWRSGDAPYLTLPDSWEKYFASVSAKFRQNVRNRLMRLSHLGEPALETLTDGPDLLNALDDAFRLEASGWKAQEGTSICSDPAIRRFYSLLAERAAARGWMRLLFLKVNGGRIATSYGAVYDNRLFLFKTGYDPAYEKCSPFKLLASFAIRKACDERLTEVDFLGDTEPWKLEWTETTRSHEWLYVFANTARGRLLHRAKFQVVPALKAVRGR